MQSSEKPPKTASAVHGPRLDRGERRSIGEVRTASPGARKGTALSFSGERESMMATNRRIQEKIEQEKKFVHRKIADWQQNLNYNVRPRTSSYI